MPGDLAHEVVGVSQADRDAAKALCDYAGFKWSADHLDMALDATADAFARPAGPAEVERLRAVLEIIARPFPPDCNWEHQAHACQIVAASALGHYADDRLSTMSHDVDFLATVLKSAWDKAEPSHGVTLHPVSYWATFVDMARAALAALTPPAPSQEQPASGSVEDIARAIADGFTNGNEQFDDANPDQQERYIEAARAVLALTPPAESQEQPASGSVEVERLREALTDMTAWKDRLAAGYQRAEARVSELIAWKMEAQAALASLPVQGSGSEGDGWEDIASAPIGSPDDDEPTLLLLFEPHDMGGFMFVGTFDHAKSQWFNNLDQKEQRPTRGRHLPAAPNEQR